LKDVTEKIEPGVLIMKRIFVTIYLILIAGICNSASWQNFSHESPVGGITYYDGYIWGKSGAGLWRYHPNTNEYKLIYPSDWMKSGGRIGSLYISHSGDLWFTILDEGIVQYDGINWKLYDPKMDSIYTFGSMVEDLEGTIWIKAGKKRSSYRGLAYFDGLHWRFIDEISGYSINYPVSLVNDKNGNLWLLFKDSEGKYCFARKSPNGWVVYPWPEDYGYYDFRTIFGDSKGNVWFSAVINDVASIIKLSPGGEYTPMIQENFYIEAITESSSGEILMTQGPLGGKIYVIDDDEHTYFDVTPFYPEFSNPPYLTGIASLPDNSMWVFVQDGWPGPETGFVKVLNEEITRIDINFSPYPSYVSKVSLRGKHGAFSRYELKDIKNPDDLTKLDLVGSYGKDILIDSSDRIWFAGRELASVLDGVPTYHSDGAWYPEEEKCYSVAEGPDGAIWVGMQNHLYYYKNDTWTEAEMTSYSRSENLAVDTHGNVWMANRYDGLSKYDGRNRLAVDIPPYVDDVAADSKGGIWVSTHPWFDDESRGGLFYVLGETITRYTEENGLPSRYITSLAVAPDDSVWFAFRNYLFIEEQTIRTTGGICHFDGEEIEIYRPEDGLSSHDVMDIAVSEIGIVWCATDVGLSTLNLNVIPDPKVRTAVNRHLLKEGDEFKLGLNIQNRGPKRDVKLVLAFIYQDVILFFDFEIGQFTNIYSDVLITLPEKIKVTPTLWQLETPRGLVGISCDFASAFFEPETSALIGEVSIQTIKFVEDN